MFMIISMTTWRQLREACGRLWRLATQGEANCQHRLGAQAVEREKKKRKRRAGRGDGGGDARRGWVGTRTSLAFSSSLLASATRHGCLFSPPCLLVSSGDGPLILAATQTVSALYLQAEMTWREVTWRVHCASRCRSPECETEREKDGRVQTKVLYSNSVGSLKTTFLLLSW